MLDPTNDEGKPIPITCRLITKARQAAGRSTRECVEAIGISPKRYLQIESGQIIPSLPEVELLAYFFDRQPRDLLAEEDHEFVAAHVGIEQMKQLVQLRQRIISATLQLIRSQKKISVKDLAAQTGVPASKIKRYELTAPPIPLDDLMLICKTLEISLGDLMDHSSFLAETEQKQSEKVIFENLPGEIREFASDPVNHSFIKLAMRLKETGIENIENLAEELKVLAEQAKE